MTGLASFEQWTVRRDVNSGRSLAILCGLYLRARRAACAAGAIAGVALCAWALGSWILSLPDAGVKSMPFFHIQVFAPVMAACVVGASAYSPFGETERTSPRPLQPLRFGHLFGLVAWASLVLTLAALAWGLDVDDRSRMILTFLRNVGGFAGLTLLAARLTGGRLSWILPLVFSTYAMMRGMKPDGSGWERWAWPMRPIADDLSWTISLTLLTVGLAIVCVFGPRESVQGSEWGGN